MQSSVSILGIRGIPAAHGGFETFAEQLSLYLVERGWQVTVYCQLSRPDRSIYEDSWRGVRRVNISVPERGAMSTVEFDWRSISHAIADRARLALTLGYNTALFSARLRRAGIINLINMDGIEWKREKWRPYERAWLWLNERAGRRFSNHMIADHPEIAAHLAGGTTSEKISVIPYGADAINNAEAQLLEQFDLAAHPFCLVIARPEPENSVLEIVRAFSSKTRNTKLVVLGAVDPTTNTYHAQIQEAASPEVMFLGAIYDRRIVDTLRYYCSLYIHGHQVGGTNPSLVEALGAGSAVLAHDNRFNRWVAGPHARYFRDEKECEQSLNYLLAQLGVLADMKTASRQRHREEFEWQHILGQYETLLRDQLFTSTTD